MFNNSVVLFITVYKVLYLYIHTVYCYNYTEQLSSTINFNYWKKTVLL